MGLIETLLNLDPTVQVAFIGGIGGVLVAGFGLLKAWRSPTKGTNTLDKKDPALSLSDKDRAIVEDLTKEVSLLSDSVDRLRQELQAGRRR